MVRRDLVYLFLLSCLQGDLRTMYSLAVPCASEPVISSSSSDYFAVRALIDLYCVVFVSEQESVILDFPRRSIELQSGINRF